MPGPRSLSLRADDLLPMLWRLFVRLNFTLPVAVNEKRFAAAFFVFSFMKSTPIKSVLYVQTKLPEARLISKREPAPYFILGTTVKLQNYQNLNLGALEEAFSMALSGLQASPLVYQRAFSLQPGEEQAP